TRGDGLPFGFQVLEDERKLSSGVFFVLGWPHLRHMRRRSPDGFLSMEDGIYRCELLCISDIMFDVQTGWFYGLYFSGKSWFLWFHGCCCFLSALRFSSFSADLASSNPFYNFCSNHGWNAAWYTFWVSWMERRKMSFCIIFVLKN
ncbi:hypothetical protein U1Q18_042110, partial [Sarracenia purpurea var. burkii]